MIERACDGEHAFDVIAVHSYSRFFRDAFGQEFYLRKLAKHGYRLIEVEKRGTKVKKALAIDAVDSETVRLIFKLYLYVAEVDDVRRDRLNMLKMLPRSLGKACLLDLHCVAMAMAAAASRPLDNGDVTNTVLSPRDRTMAWRKFASIAVALPLP